MEAVRLEDIWVRYEQQMVLREIDLAIEEGEFLGLIGPNGGGKTTLLKVILGLIRPEVGRAEVFGIPCDRLGAKRHYIGYIPQRSLADWRFPASVFDVAITMIWISVTVFFTLSGVTQNAPQEIKVIMTPGLLLGAYSLVWIGKKAWSGVS